MRTGVLFSMLLVACANDVAEQQTVGGAVAGPPAVAGSSEPQREDSSSRCSARIRAIGQVPALPGTPALDANRAPVLARAKGEPVVFLREPELEPAATPQVLYFRRRLADAQSPARALRDVYTEIRNVPELARSVLLREGYLYATSPAFAEELALIVRLKHLFRAPRILIQRGSTVRGAIRDDDGEYVYESGVEAGTRVSVLLFDRVWEDGVHLGPALHRTVDGILEQTGADRIELTRLTEEGAVARLRYGDEWVSAALAHDGARFVLDCEDISESARPTVELVRRLAAVRRRVLRAQHEAIDAQVRERLPFDEPRTEEGQQDGELRREWKWAYTHEWTIYHFNDDTYRVFNADGSPRVPQVCIDFIVDTLERAGGSWWQPMGQKRAKTAGLDLEALGIDNRRSVERFVNFAWDHPEWFEVYDLDVAERVPFYRKEEFFEHLREHADRYVPGDIVTIFGPRGDENHYHSFFVYRSDPVTGMPIWVAANAGKPRIRAWATEMRSGPRRWISSRVRPRPEWLVTTLAKEQRQAARSSEGSPRG